MVDDIKNDRFELEDKSEGYSSMEIPEPKVVAAEPEIEAAVEAAAEEPAVEAAAEEPTTSSSDSNETSDSPSSNDEDFDEKHDHKK